MADSLNTPTLSKLHPGLSRRSLMREMAAAGMLAAVPVAAIAAPLPAPPRTSPLVRLAELIAEIQAVAQEIDPTIKEWVIDMKDIRTGGGVPLVIAAFANPPDTDPLLQFGWTYRHAGAYSVRARS